MRLSLSLRFPTTTSLALLSCYSYWVAGIPRHVSAGPSLFLMSGQFHRKICEEYVRGKAGLSEA